MDYNFKNNNPELVKWIKSLGKGNVVHDPYCPFCRGIGVMSIPMPLVNDGKTIGYHVQITCWSCFANIRSFGKTKEEAKTNAKEKWSTRY